MPRSRLLVNPEILLALAPLAARGASMNVHTLVGERAHAYYSGLAPGVGITPAQQAAFEAAIRGNLDYVAGGSDFPDFLYACGAYADHHDAGEAAHWPPFQAASIQYVQSNWPDPTQWDAEVQGLVAFIFGVAVHYVTDELWEGLADPLGARRGFTEQVDTFQLGNAGHGNVAEGVSNWGGDMYAAWSLDESNVSSWSRKFPVKHMAQIFHATPKDGVFAPNATNFTDVTELSLAGCEVLFDLGLWALQTFGAWLYPFYNDREYSHQLPLIQERLLETVLVGLDDMAAATTFAWGRVGRWLADPAGPPLTPPKRRTTDMWARAAADDADDRAVHELFRRLKPFTVHTEALRQLQPSQARRSPRHPSTTPFPTPRQHRSPAPPLLLRTLGPTLTFTLACAGAPLLRSRCGGGGGRGGHTRGRGRGSGGSDETTCGAELRGASGARGGAPRHPVRSDRPLPSGHRLRTAFGGQRRSRRRDLRGGPKHGGGWRWRLERRVKRRGVEESGGSHSGS